jgi:UDP-glucose 4-epimerase
MTKLACDMAITSYARAYGMSAVSLRFFNVAGAYKTFGERHDPESHIIPIALAAAAGDRPQFSLFGDDYDTPDGSCIRDYIHVLDLADAVLLALDRMPQDAHTIYNLGNGDGYSNKQVISVVEEITGTELKVVNEPRRPGDPPKLVASNDRIKRDLGWAPKRPELREMVQSAWEFYKSTHQ